MKKSRECVKFLVNFASTVEEADSIINENYDFKTIGEKIAFLKGMFDVKIISKDDVEGVSKEKSDEMTYFAMLSTIINN